MTSNPSPENFECRNCQYDLRNLNVHSESIRCPECGVVGTLAELTAVRDAPTFLYCTRMLCGPTALSGLLLLSTAVFASSWIVTGGFVVLWLCALVLPPVVAPLLIRGRARPRDRKYWAMLAMVGAWPVNIAMAVLMSAAASVLR